MTSTQIAAYEARERRLIAAICSDGDTARTRRLFRALIRSYYTRHGRAFPWRGAAPVASSRAAYRVLVSEIMLQQTQAARVSEKYVGFLKAFPTFEALAAASTADVLRAWQGLGYNRRALKLKNAAEQVVCNHDGMLPRDELVLSTLPGIGTYTAAALSAFVFNRPSIVLETNIRTVYLYFYFSSAERLIDDEEVRELIAATLDRQSPASWYHALMDYGAFLKGRGVRNNARSKGYRPQSRFEGSERQLRGAILRLLALSGPLSEAALVRRGELEPARVRPAIERLIAEGLIVKSARRLSLPS